MNDQYFDLKRVTSLNEKIFKPVFFHITSEQEELAFKNQLNECAFIYDEIYGQLKELIKGRHPSRKLTEVDYTHFINEHLNGRKIEWYGVWVYYPWSRRMVHLLPEAEFIELRTNRNQYKITPQQRDLLAQKKIGIIGLSVGHSAALTIAMERSCGELRLADFDQLDLSNLNRIRTGVHNLNVPKVILAAREIAEIDPFLEIKIFTEGLTEANIDSFLHDGGKLDVVVEVCDGLDVKILSRYKARAAGIPVVMDTSDRGMVDIERFDLEPDRPLLHGLAGDLDPAGMKGLTNEQKIPYILQMIDAENISVSLKASMMEVETSITTWPQLATSVTLGGAVGADVCRRILLDQLHVSGRYYVDLDRLISDEQMPAPAPVLTNPYTPLTEEAMRSSAAQASAAIPADAASLNDAQRQALMEAARLAPSAGNNQPWKWLVQDRAMYLFHDRHRSYSWGDYGALGAYVGLGAAIENVSLRALELGLEAQVQSFPLSSDPAFTALITFRQAATGDPLLLSLAAGIEQRMTNRMLGARVSLPESFYTGIREAISSVPGVSVQFITDPGQLEQAGEIIAACDRLRLLYPQGHEEFFHELRWNGEEAAKTGDGIDISLVDITASEVAGFRVAKDAGAIQLLSDWNLGNAFMKMSRKGVAAASALALVTVPAFDERWFLEAGRAVERGWIYAGLNKVAFHPMLSPVFFFNRLLHGKGAEMTGRMKDDLTRLRTVYEQVFRTDNARTEVFLFKLAMTDKIAGKTYRLPHRQIFVEGQ